MLCVGVLLALSAIAWPVLAEMGAGEYQVRDSLGSPEEQKRIRRDIQAEIEAERQRAAAREEEAREQAFAEERRRAALPFEVRLLNDRCIACHSADNFTGKGYGWLGWQAVILRMEWLNGAQLKAGERGVIATHLAMTQPAPLAWLAVEWFLLLSPLVVAIVFSVLGWGRRG